MPRQLDDPLALGLHPDHLLLRLQAPAHAFLALRRQLLGALRCGLERRLHRVIVGLRAARERLEPLELLQLLLHELTLFLRLLTLLALLTLLLLRALLQLRLLPLQRLELPLQRLVLLLLGSILGVRSRQLLAQSRALLGELILGGFQRIDGAAEPLFQLHHPLLVPLLSGGGEVCELPLRSLGLAREGVLLLLERASRHGGRCERRGQGSEQ